DLVVVETHARADPLVVGPLVRAAPQVRDAQDDQLGGAAVQHAERHHHPGVGEPRGEEPAGVAEGGEEVHVARAGDACTEPVDGPAERAELPEAAGPDAGDLRGGAVVAVAALVGLAHGRQGRLAVPPGADGWSGRYGETEDRLSFTRVTWLSGGE